MQLRRSGTCALLALLLPLVAGAQEILLDFRSTELARIVDAIAQQTGQRFVHDDTLRGNVTIAVPRRATPREALAVLDAALLLHGFAALPGPAGVRKIVRIEGMAGTAPWLAAPPGRDSEAPVATLIRLDAAPVAEVGQVLRQLAGRGAVLVDLPDSNAILIAASEAMVRRLLQLARALDQAGDRELRVLPLRYRDAASIEPLLEGALADDGAVHAPVRVVGDERTGSLVVEGRREDLARAEALLRTLDLPLPGRRDLHVVRVLNADAERLAETLDALVQDGELGVDPAATPVRIVVDPPTHSLVIQAAPPVFASLARAIAELDVPPQRVSVELAVVEASLSGNLSLGFDSLLAIGRTPDDLAEIQERGTVLVGTGNPLNLVGEVAPAERFVGRITTAPVLIPVGGPGGIVASVPINFGGVVRAEAGEAHFHTLHQPHLLMTSGDEHAIQAGLNVPVPVSAGVTPVAQGGGTGLPISSGLTTEVSFQRQDTGVDLRMTPTVFSAQSVALQLELTVSELAGTAADLGPTIISRDLSAQVRLRDGEIALVAALNEPKRSEARVAVPFLGRIPILGQLLTIRRDVQSRRVLIITAQPTVVGSPADELARSIRQRLAFERQLARTRALEAPAAAPYALLLDTRDSRAAAETVAAELADPRWRVQLAAWKSGELEQWDVYATGFETLGEASLASIALRELGWQPGLAVLSRRLE